MIPEKDYEKSKQLGLVKGLCYQLGSFECFFTGHGAFLPYVLNVKLNAAVSK